MKIFLSHAAEDKAAAEAITFSLRNRGHDVFLDRDDLPAGRSYDDQIENAVRISDAMIFLVSPISIAPGRYTLTELEYARKHWPYPNNRVLPVMIAATDLASIPTYLKAVTILEPKGNVAAEVASCVDEMARNAVAPNLTAVTILAGALSALIAGGSTLLAGKIPQWFPPLATVQQGVEHVAWAAVLPMFFYFRNAFAKAKVLRSGAPLPVESSRYRFWRYAFLAAFILIAVVEILNILMTTFATSFLAGLADAGFLQQGVMNNPASVQRLNEMLIQTQAIVILPVMVLCGLVVGWTAHTLSLRRPMYYLLALTLVLFALRAIEFAAGMGLRSPGVVTIAKTVPGILGFFFLLPILLFVVALIAYGTRSLLRKAASLFSGGGTGPAQVPA